MLVPSDKARAKEAVLAYGVYGAGKSETWCGWADMYRKTDTPGTFRVIETVHEASEVLAEGYPDWDDNVVCEEVTDWDSLNAVSAKFKEAGSPNDVLVVETIGNAQLWSRDHWFQANRGGMTWKEFQISGGSAKDIKPHQWIEMDELHRGWLNEYVMGFPGHRVATAGGDAVRTEAGFSDNKMVRDMFGRIGVKPIGHKDLGYAFRSILLMTHPAKDEYEMTTVDDPKREHLDHVPVASRFDVERGLVVPGFIATWLEPVAGWRLT